MDRILILSFFSILLLGGCSQNYKTAQQEDSMVFEKMSDIEDETITRMSFVDMQGEYDDVDVVLYQDGSKLNEIIPASGGDFNKENNPNKQ